MTEISVRTWIAAPVDACFDLARDVAVHAESAAFSGERLVSPGRLSGLLEAGDLLCFEGRHFGVRRHFCTRITGVNRPHSFTDEMVSGFFRFLRHTHSFLTADNGTLMTDHLVWRSPLGAIGDVLFLRRHMERFVRTKQGELKRIAERR